MEITKEVITKELMDELLRLLGPHMRDVDERQAYLQRAFVKDTSIINRMVWNTPVNVFIPNMVNLLVEFGEIGSGKSALCALLEVIREDVGIDRQESINNIIGALRNQKSPPRILYDLLLQIDFKQQVQLAKKVIDKHRVAAFLIHGEPNCGQDILLERLLRLKPGWQNRQPIKINLTEGGVGKKLPRLWQKLAYELELPRDTVSEDIINKVCHNWQTQDVTFIFYPVEYMLSDNNLSVWLEKFWEQLVDKAKQNMGQSETHLLLFLVDYCGDVCNSSNVKLTEEFEKPEYPRIPLNLPPASKFQEDVLDDWMNVATVFRDVRIPPDLTSKILLENSENGTPELVYEEICKRFGIDWSSLLSLGKKES